MVVFTCNACSAALKRNQVDKHCYQCRRCESLSCVDCGKDFWGDDYLQHTKCITEEEKYGGKDVAPKVFKGEAKQEQWVEQVQIAIKKASSKPGLKGLLERLRDYPNIPRKKAKFENFVKNSLRVNNPSLIAEVWALLMAENVKTQQGKGIELDKSNANSNSESASISNGHENELNNPTDNDAVESANASKSKREKKEERRKKSQKREKKDKVLENEETINAHIEGPKKSKKRKRHELEEIEDRNVENDEEVKQVDKKKKKKNKVDCCTVTTIGDDGCDDENRLEVSETEDTPPAKRKKTKFNWEKTIKAVLEKKGEMTLKKLKKKVLGEFAAQDAANYNEENLSAKFDKKVLRTEGVKVLKDRASLKSN